MLDFYRLFGFEIDTTMAPNLYAVQLQTQKLNFHSPSLWQNKKFTLRGPTAQPGCGDLCFQWRSSVADLQSILAKNQIEVEEGPVERTGGNGLGISVYVRDPDGNLVEFISYED